jgi:hypothetical protein
MTHETETETDMDTCPVCGYAGAMLCEAVHPDPGRTVSWLRCHRCGTDRELP